MKKSTNTISHIAFIIIAIGLIASAFIIPIGKNNTGGITFRKNNVTYNSQGVSDSYTSMLQAPKDISFERPTLQNNANKAALLPALSSKGSLSKKNAVNAQANNKIELQNRRIAHYSNLGKSSTYNMRTGNLNAQTGGSVNEVRLLANNKPFDSQNITINNAANASTMTRIAEDPLNPGTPVGDAVLPIMFFAAMYLGIKKNKGIF